MLIRMPKKGLVVCLNMCRTLQCVDAVAPSHGQCARLLTEQSSLETSPGLLCCVLGKDS